MENNNNNKKPYPNDTADYTKVPAYPPAYDYTTSTAINQPQVLIAMPPSSMEQPKSYLACSILNTFCCCLCFGIVAIIFSVKTREANKYGNYEEAMTNSKKAKKFNIIALSLGLCILIFYIVTYVLRIVAALNANSVETVYAP